MIYLVTEQSNTISFNSPTEIMVTPNLGAIEKIVKAHDSVIFHTSTEDRNESIRIFTLFGSLNVRLFALGYHNIIITQLVRAFNGIVYEDDTVVSDLDTLQYLTSDEAYTELVALHNSASELQSITSYTTRILDAMKRNDSETLNNLKSNSFLKSFCEAGIKLVNLVNKTNQREADSVTEVVTLIQYLLNCVNEATLGISSTALELQRAKEELTLLQKKNTSGDLSRINTYPAYNVSSTEDCKVLYIKEYTHCSFLTSMLACYMYYLQNVHSLDNARLLVVHPNSTISKVKYSTNFSTINPTTIKHEIPKDTILATCEPTKDVFDCLLNNSDVLIVLDRLQRNGRLVTGSNVTSKNAFGTVTDITIFTSKDNLPLDSVIQSSISDPHFVGVSIPTLPGYRGSEEMIRKHLYSGALKDTVFSRFSKELGLIF